MLAMLAIAQTGCEREAAKEDQKRAATSPATTRTASGGDATPEEEKEEVSPVDVKLGLAISSYVHAIGWIARDAGEFERNGVTPTIEVMGGSAATMRALIGGSIDVGLAGARGRRRWAAEAGPGCRTPSERAGGGGGGGGQTCGPLSWAA